MDKKEIKAVFDRQKERMKMAIRELSDVRELLPLSHRGRIDHTIDTLKVCLKDDEQTFARLQADAETRKDN